MPSAPCEHHKLGSYVRRDLIPGYAEIGLTCVHGHMLDTADQPDPSPPNASTASAEPLAPLDEYGSTSPM